MKPLLHELKHLETIGITINYKGIERTLKGTISYICQDNLAGNSIGGFIESFGSNIDCNSLKLTLNYFLI